MAAHAAVRTMPVVTVLGAVTLRTEAQRVGQRDVGSVREVQLAAVRLRMARSTRQLAMTEGEPRVRCADLASALWELTLLTRFVARPTRHHRGSPRHVEGAHRQALQHPRRVDGHGVARLVEAVSEQKLEGTELLPWRHRKEAQLAHLKSADRHIAAIKTADALHNLRATLSDLHRQGNQVWERFRGSQTEHLWYYESLSEVLKSKLGDHPLSHELAQAIRELRTHLPTP